MLEAPPETEFTFLSLGAGVQSSAMALMAKHGEITPMPDAAIFADTQAEPREVYQWLDWLEGELPFPVIRVTKGSLVGKELLVRTSGKSGKTYRDGKIPAFARQPDGTIGLMSRRCTADFKIEPINREMKKLAGVKRGSRDVAITQWIGISWDEIQRMKESRHPWYRNRWPLIEMRMRREQCISWMTDRGYQAPPRSACVFCPFHNDAEWRRVRDGNPEEWEAVQQFERDMQAAQERCTGGVTGTPYLHPSCVPIGEADIRSDEEKGQLTFDGIWNTIQNECEGMCGV